MRQSDHGGSGKVKLSGAVQGWTLAVLEKFRQDAGLDTRSAALCEALAQWAREYRKEAVLEKAVSKYGKLYRKAAEQEELNAARTLPLLSRVRGIP